MEPAEATRGTRNANRLSMLIISLMLVAAGLYTGWHFTSSDYLPRAKVAEALAFIKRAESPLRAACAEGRYATVNTMADIGLPLASPESGIFKVELNRIGVSTVRVRAELTNIFAPRFFGLVNWRVIAQGTGISFDMHCTDQRTLDAEFSGSRLESRYLPAAFAERR